jgi:hypothetical protein
MERQHRATVKKKQRRLSRDMANLLQGTAGKNRRRMQECREKI